jgi:ceramide glucosyltransferase
MVAPLADPGIGFVCSLYRAVGAERWFEKLELLGLNADFLPSVVFSEEVRAALFCTGATVAFRRADLEAVGGMADLGAYLVEDYELGRRLVKLRGRYAVVTTLVDLVVDYGSFRQWWNHQVYWDQNTWAANPVGFVFTILTRAVPFAALYWLARGFDGAGLAVLLAALVIRLGTATVFLRDFLHDREGLGAIALLPLRDLIGLASWYVALTRRSFVWRGHRFGLTRDGRIVPREAGAAS